jgi:Domain of unknown function (DUF4279)
MLSRVAHPNCACQKCKMGPQRTVLSLHLRHPTRDLSAICAALQLVPRHIWTKGDEHQTPKGTKTGGIRDSSYCSIDLGVTSQEPLSDKIEAALALLKPHRGILRELSSTGGQVSFYIGWFCDEHTGEGLSWQILEEMSDLRIELELNIYVPDERLSSGEELGET